MLLRQEPPVGEYITISVIDDKKQELDKMGFMPMYLYNGKFFYRCTEELKEYLEKAVRE